MERETPGRAGVLIAAAAAVLCGCCLLLALQAPVRMPLMNAAALLIGLVAAQLLWLLRGASRALGDGVLLAAALALPATALFGSETDGVARWINVAGLTIQPAMILVPVVVIGFASAPTILRLAALGLAALGVGMQPDLGAAAMLLSGTGAIAWRARSVPATIGLLLALAGTALAWLRPADLPPARYVEQVLEAAMLAGPVPATLALLGVILLFLPAFLMRRAAAAPLTAAFAGVWAGGLVAALAGSYPTPVLGFGGSAVLGYLLSVGLTIMLIANHGARPKLAARVKGGELECVCC